jgi:Flp pilus assembly protein TadD
VALDPPSGRALAFLGAVTFGLGDVARAETLLRQAVAVNEARESPEAVPPLEYGMFLQRTDRTEESLVPLRRAAELDSRNLEARFQLGRSLHRLGRLEEAAAALRGALEIDGTDPRVHYLLGRVCYEQGDRSCGEAHMRLSEKGRGR